MRKFLLLSFFGLALLCSPTLFAAPERDNKGGMNMDHNDHPPHDHHQHDHLKYLRGHGHGRKKYIKKKS